MNQTKAEKAHGVALDNLAKLNTRKDELSIAGEESKVDLASFRKESAQALIEGQSSEKVASALAARESKAAMFAGALAEINMQIAHAQAEADKAAQKWNAEVDAETVREIRSTTVKIIKRMGAMQIELARTAKLQQTTGRVIVNFDAAATKLEESQATLEHDAKVRERSEVPNAARRGGWLDDTHTIATLGSAVRDWAAAQVTK